MNDFVVLYQCSAHLGAPKLRASLKSALNSSNLKALAI